MLAILIIKVFRRTPISAQSSITRRLGDRCHRLSSCRRTPTRRLKTAPTAAASPILKATGASGYIPAASAAATLYKQKTPLSTDSGGCCLEGIVEVIHVRGHPIRGEMIWKENEAMRGRKASPGCQKDNEPVRGSEKEGRRHSSIHSRREPISRSTRHQP